MGDIITGLLNLFRKAIDGPAEHLPLSMQRIHMHMYCEDVIRVETRYFDSRFNCCGGRGFSR